MEDEDSTKELVEDEGPGKELLNNENLRTS